MPPKRITQNKKKSTKHSVQPEPKEDNTSFLQKSGIAVTKENLPISCVRALFELRHEYEHAIELTHQNRIIDDASEQLNLLIASAGEWVIQILFSQLLRQQNSVPDNWKADDSEQFINILRYMLNTFHTVLPRPLLRQLLEEFQKLELGAKSDLLAPANIQYVGNNAGLAFPLQMLEIRALEHVHFRIGLGMSLKEARITVAEIYGYAAESGYDVIRKWESRKLRDNIIKDPKRPATAEEEITWLARNRALMAQKYSRRFKTLLQKLGHTKDVTTILKYPHKIEIDDDFFARMIADFSNARLKQDGADYQKLKRQNLK